MRGGQMIFIISVAAITVMAVWFLISQSSVPPALPPTDKPDQGLRIGASIPPLRSIARSIGGDKVMVISLLPPGASPHTFEPKISELTRLQSAKIVFTIGHGLDDWALKMVDDPATVLTVDSGVALRPSRDQDSAGPADPHYWLSFANTRRIAENMAVELKALDPAHTEYYAANLKKFQQDSRAAEARSRQELAGLPRREIITFHDAWEYFAAEMDLEVVATFEPAAGREPTPQYLKELQQTTRRYQINTIFSEPQLSTETLDAFLADLGVNVRDLDPLGDGQGEVSFLATLEQNAQIMAESLK